MGERSPHNDPSARAAVYRMSMDTDRADMLAGVVFEGVAYGLRDSLEVAKSLVWHQKAQQSVVAVQRVCFGER